MACMGRFALSVFVTATLLGVGTAQAATTPTGAAGATRDCLRAHGWSAVLADGGRSVGAQAPRKLAGFPPWPWFSVSFFSSSVDGRSVVNFTESRMKLNRTEAEVATSCRDRSLRR